MTAATAAAKTRILIYGAYGYTGRLTAGLAASRRIDVLLAGRNPQALTPLADRLHMPTRAVGLDHPGLLRDALADVACVVHMAGPFAATAAPMLDACLATRTHYVDITGEIAVFEAMWARRDEIGRAGVTVMPGSGFDIVPSDCLAAYTARRLRQPRTIVLAFRGLDAASRGTLQTAIREIASPVLCRRAGRIVPLDDPSPLAVDFGSGDEPCLPVSWGDVATAFYSTGAGDVTTYFRRTAMLRAATIAQKYFGRILGTAGARRALTALMRRAPDGPGEAERRTRRVTIWCEATDAESTRVRATLSTPDPYDLTAALALEAAQRIVRSPALGLTTPSHAFGVDFVLGFEGCTRRDVP